MTYTMNDWINTLNLEPHPEGGYYRQTYRDEQHRVQPEGFSGSRPVSTAIVFLLNAGAFSAFHRIKSDELVHFYTGDPLELLWINAQGELVTERLGLDPERGFLPQRMIPANHWFAWHLCPEGKPSHGYALAGCNVAPGFDEADFEVADRLTLSVEYPQHSAIIEQLTR